VSGYRNFGRSNGWSGEAAALDAALLLDTEEASHAVADVVGFFATDAGSWIVVRGGTVERGCGRFWREAVALDATQLARVRANPFRILPRSAPDFPHEPYGELAAPVVPEVSAEADRQRIIELVEKGAGRLGRGALEALLAAILDAEHTLVVPSAWTHDELELLILLLPPQLRGALTFHTHALSVPREPIPRLVLTPLTDPAAFEPPQPLWGHRLPATELKVSRRAQLAARDLLDLVGRLDLLAAAHDAYDGFADRLRPSRGALLDEICTLLRFARFTAARATMDVRSGLCVLTETFAAHDRADHPETLCFAELMHTSFSPAGTGTAVAGALMRGGTVAQAATLLIEQFGGRKGGRPAEFAEFALPIERAISELTSTAAHRSPDLCTMLLLLAASRGDVDGMVASLTLPIDGDVVARFGGIEMWLPDDPVLAGALRAFVVCGTAEGASAALAGLRVLVARATVCPAHLRLADAAVACVRQAYCALPPEEWQEALPIAPDALELSVALTAVTRMSLYGIPSTDHYREMIGRSDDPRAKPVFDHQQDAELFLGFLGVDASRSRLAPGEIMLHGAALARALNGRIRGQASDTAEAGEGVHWSLALLERVRRRELNPQYACLAIELLRLAAPASAGSRLRAYFENAPGIAGALVAHAEPLAILNAAQRESLAAVTLADAVTTAIEARDTAPVSAACERLRVLGVQVDTALFVDRVEEPLTALMRTLQSHGSRPNSVYAETLYRLLEPLVARDAQPPLRRALSIAASALDAQALATVAKPEQPTLSATNSTRFRRLVRRTAPLVGAVTFGVTAVLLASETGLRALLAGAAESGSARTAAEISALEPEERLAEARMEANRGRWSDVVQLLGTDPIEPVSRQSFAWDSLLVSGALRLGLGLPSHDVQRTPLLALARRRAEHALELAAPGREGRDFLRLVRAEACLAAPLHCGPTAILEDLTVASTSPARDVRARAGQVLASIGR
jgi:hypothetical protein